MNRNSPQLGRLQRVDLRVVWADEAKGFTPWLALPENIALLSEAIGMELEVEAQEKDVGPFRADILCRDAATNDWVLIENQLERTDHTHLGQLLTYAAGLKAVTIVWLASRFTDEHRAVLDWLNEVTAEKFQLFGLEVEAWRIGDSPIAPKFNVVSKPNDWSRGAAEGATRVAADLTDTQRLQLEFWTAFREYANRHAKRIRATKPLPQQWMNFAIGRAWTHLSGIVLIRKTSAKGEDPGELRVELFVDSRVAPGAYELLLVQQAEIERQFGCRLAWQAPEGKRGRWIFLSRAASPLVRERWEEYFRWLVETADKFHEVFQPRVREISAGAPTPPDEDASSPR